MCRRGSVYHRREEYDRPKIDRNDRHTLARDISLYPPFAIRWKSVILLGDFMQLPPVSDTPLYSQKLALTTNNLSDFGHHAYASFTTVVTLTEIMRQRGETEEQKWFREALLRLREGQVTPEDYTRFMQRTLARLPLFEIDTFKDALRIFTTKSKVERYNSDKLLSFNRPVSLIKAKHTGAGAETATADTQKAWRRSCHFALVPASC
ncbi:hypothetical protein PsorP6_011638 [Peronosclerospora sorghi]|uniref:Uncharacterized protein n=1 Tax=Peronosclerospora sorghi TaxID=230839 RepID=A0ACC0WLV3_9STRA|nr:hypothetical protein PsorP6_011638 [Peronosclerospora sorghi]